MASHREKLGRFLESTRVQHFIRTWVSRRRDGELRGGQAQDEQLNVCSPPERSRGGFVRMKDRIEHEAD